LFTSLVVGSAVFLLSSLVRRLRSPNPLVDMPYLRKWNTILLGIALFAFRFVLLATIIVVPQSLAVHGLDAAQYGPAVLWTAIPELLLAFLGAMLLNRGFDTRLLMAIGFTSVAFACLLNASFTSAWSAENYYRTELLMAVGQSFAFMGLVSSILLQAFTSGGMDVPQRILTFSAFLHTVRLLGGQCGVILLTHFIAEREKLHSFLLGLHVQSGNWIADTRLHQLTAGLSAKSSGLNQAAGRAAGVIGGQLRLQAYSLTFIDAFYLIAWACVANLLLIAMLHRSPINFAIISGRQAPPAPTPPVPTPGKEKP
jgi:DHA2 family multidrug resistance protein